MITLSGYKKPRSCFNFAVQEAGFGLHSGVYTIICKAIRTQDKRQIRAAKLP